MRSITAIVAIVMALASCTADTRTTTRTAPRPSPPSESPASTPTRPPRPRVADSWGRAPSDCPVTREPEPVSRLYGPLVGQSPFWAGVYARFDDSRGAFRTNAPRKRGGYRIKVLWIMEARNEDPFTLTGHHLETHEPVSFAFEGPTRPFARLDPEEPGTVSGNPRWAEFPSYVFFPRAGCYLLETGTSRGPWRLVLSIGR